jgi:HAD superfamily hydrolase (TIGR01509 family)
MPAVEAVFFDLGDTISDLREGQDDYMQRVKQRTGYVYEALAAAGVMLPDREAFCTHLGEETERRYLAAQAQLRSLTIYEAMRAILGDAGLPTNDGLVIAAGDAYCTGAKTPMQLRLGAREVLTALNDAGLRLGVISNTIQPGRFMDASLTRQGLMHFFPARIYSSEAGVPKPHPEIFRQALDALGVSPEGAVHVGDRLVADVQGAQGAGMRGVLIQVTQRREQSDHITPDARIRELPELLHVPFIADAIRQAK